MEKTREKLFSSLKDLIYALEHHLDLRECGGDELGLDDIGQIISAVDLSGADLSGLNFDDVNLSGADLRGANLKGADLSWARLEGTLLNGAEVDDGTVFPDGFDSDRLISRYCRQCKMYATLVPEGFPTDGSWGTCLSEHQSTSTTNATTADWQSCSYYEPAEEV